MDGGAFLTFTVEPAEESVRNSSPLPTGSTAFMRPSFYVNVSKLHSLEHSTRTHSQSKQTTTEKG